MLRRTVLLACFLFGSSAAFAVVQPTPTPPAFAVRSNVLKMSGGDAELKAPPALYQGAVAAGTKKAQNSFGNIFKLGIVAGCHIAFGAYLAISVGGACPGLAASNPGLQKVRDF